MTRPDTNTVYRIEQWANNEDGWDTDTGNPGIMYVANAIQAWSTFQKRDCTLSEAAKVFNLHADDVKAAVEAHPWMLITKRGDVEYIDHDGE